MNCVARFAWMLPVGLLALVSVPAAQAVPAHPLSKPTSPKPKPPEVVAADGQPASAGEPAAEQQQAAPSEVELKVSQHSPGLPWRYQIRNVGKRPVRVAADPRLLWFEVEVPGKKKRQTCRLPASLFPTFADKHFSLVLRPGDSFGQRFDPRLYCFAAGGQTELVSGSVVYPRFGWPKQHVTSWKSGKKITTEKLLAPFAVTPPERSGGKPRRGARAKAQTQARPKADTHLKLVEGKAFSLTTAYAGWSKSALPDETKMSQDGDWDAPEPSLSMTTGSDAAAERLATVSVRLKNPSTSRKLVVYFRRELMSFEVMGPDGVVSCEPEPRERFPEPQAFTTLGAGKSIVVTSRLVELCPRRTFDRPGLYLIRARFESKDSGAEFGLQAFTGRVVADQPATVRIRGGEKPFRLSPR